MGGRTPEDVDFREKRRKFAFESPSGTRFQGRFQGAVQGVERPAQVSLTLGRVEGGQFT